MWSSSCKNRSEGAANFITASRNIVAAVLLMSGVLLNILLVRNSILSRQLYDFGSFIASGKEALQGKDPYAVGDPLIFRVEFEKVGIGSWLPNANPPISVLAFEPLANLPPLEVLTFWRVASVISYLAAVILLLRNHREHATFFRILWSLGLAGFWHTIELGQIYAVLLLLISWAWILIEKRKFWYAAILAGLAIAIKPNLSIWALLLGVAGNRIFFLVAIATAGLISIIPAMVYGPQIYIQWLSAANEIQALAFPGNSSLTGLFVRFGLPQVGMIAGVLIVLFVVLWVARRKNSSADTIGGIGIVVSLLASPIAWTGYTIFLLPYFLTKQTWTSLETLAAINFSFPFLLVLLLFQQSKAAFIILGWFYGWGLLILLINFLFLLTHAQPASPKGQKGETP